MVCKDGVVLGCEKKLHSKLLIPESKENIHELDSHIVCAVSGLTADAKNLIEHARSTAQVQFLLPAMINSEPPLRLPRKALSFRLNLGGQRPGPQLRRGRHHYQEETDGQALRCGTADRWDR